MNTYDYLMLSVCGFLSAKYLVDISLAAVNGLGTDQEYRIVAAFAMSQFIVYLLALQSGQLR